jgi:sugar lactone lactonase YvrE
MSLRSAVRKVRLGAIAAPTPSRACAEIRRLVYVLVVASVFGCLGVGGAANAAVTVRVWGGSGMGDGQFQTAQYLATNQAGEVYVSDNKNERVEKFSATGQFLTKWTVPGRPLGIAVDKDGHVWVSTGASGFTISEYDASGNPITSWPTTQYGGSVALDSAGYVYVADANGLVTKYQPDGTQVTQWSTSRSNSVLDIFDIAIDEQNNVYVSQFVLGRIEKYTTDGALQTAWGAPAGAFSPVGLGVDAIGHVYAADEGDARFWLFNSDGGNPVSFGTSGTAAGQFKNAWDVAPDRFGNAFVLDSELSRVTQVDMTRSPDEGPVGVSINDGAQFTNDPDVTVYVRWPQLAQSLVISNDGGFRPSKTFALDKTISWRLSSSGPERLPKTIYVRFSGGGSDSQTFQDDIILDQTRPIIEQASAAPAPGATRRIVAWTRSAKARTVRVKTRAKDNLSGVARIQITRNKRKPGPALSYKSKRLFKTSASTIFVRVRDRAGNWSRWRTVKVGRK